MKEDFWALTSYFNPGHWKTRKENYKTFRNSLQLPLLAIEWSLSGEFELSPSDADLLIQVTGGDLLWQKERLLNIGINQLPESCQYVAWVDADIVFGDPGWTDQARALLKRETVIQLFSKVYHLTHDARWPSKTDFFHENYGVVAGWIQSRHRPEFVDSFLTNYSLRMQGRSPDPHLPAFAFGFAWAARREWLNAIGGLYDASIIGNGDTVFFCALISRLEDMMTTFRRNDAACMDGRRLRDWEANLRSHNPGIGCLPGDAFHLFHGPPEGRRYIPRLKELYASGFRIDDHLIDEPGAPWKFATECPSQALELMERYFRCRREDDTRA